MKPLKLVSKKEEEEKSCQENQSDLDEYKTKTCTNKVKCSFKKKMQVKSDGAKDDQHQCVYGAFKKTRIQGLTKKKDN